VILRPERRRIEGPRILFQGINTQPVHTRSSVSRASSYWVESFVILGRELRHTGGWLGWLGWLGL